MATKAEVRNKALRKLRVLEEGGTPSSEAITDVEEAFDEIYAYLARKNAVSWDSDENVPDEAVRPFVTILAAEMADDFGAEESRYRRLQTEAYGPDGDKENINGGAVATLIYLASNNYVPRPTAAEYY